ncbi:AcrR family transcriptional regulator [Glaciihabitans tibetensis]|uniref:AcrR family transcriptional regulator n=2 Tax=Glaciihabitans tibetensis TaxID=1266600 RepID=A0A2T0VIR0_9MICO|nr:AcrR family transcriptional regulator [Glaciihabitans tibetensis]
MVHYGEMDARAQRTRDQLESAILDLATLRPLSEITVTDIARAASITRPTFYAHAESPGDLLASVLGKELEHIREEFARAAELLPDGQVLPLEQLNRALVRHCHDNAALYRNNLVRRLPREMRDVLIDHIEWALSDHLLRHPHLAPRALHGDPEDAEYRYRQFAFYAAIAASGTVAALETWLRSPDPLDPDWAVRAITRGNAEWWQHGH